MSRRRHRAEEGSDVKEKEDGEKKSRVVEWKTLPMIPPRPLVTWPIGWTLPVVMMPANERYVVTQTTLYSFSNRGDNNECVEVFDLETGKRILPETSMWLSDMKIHHEAYDATYIYVTGTKVIDDDESVLCIMRLGPDPLEWRYIPCLSGDEWQVENHHDMYLTHPNRLVLTVENTVSHDTQIVRIMLDKELVRRALSPGPSTDRLDDIERTRDADDTPVYIHGKIWELDYCCVEWESGTVPEWVTVRVDHHDRIVFGCSRRPGYDSNDKYLLFIQNDVLILGDVKQRKKWFTLPLDKNDSKPTTYRIVIRHQTPYLLGMDTRWVTCIQLGWTVSNRTQFDADMGHLLTKALQNIVMDYLGDEVVLWMHDTGHFDSVPIRCMMGSQYALWVYWAVEGVENDPTVMHMQRLDPQTGACLEHGSVRGNHIQFPAMADELISDELPEVLPNGRPCIKLSEPRIS